MHKIEFDCAQVSDRADLHRLLAQLLEFPAWYGGNLDAMYDCLTELDRDVELTLLHWRQLKESLGDYASRLVYVLHRASEENPHFRVTLENGYGSSA